MMDNNLLLSLVTVAETASFSRAARRLGQTQSTVSQQIRRLEEQLNCVLIERTTHVLRLTEAGTKFLAHARSILHAVEDAEFAMHPSTLRGSVRLGMAEDFAASRLPEILARFRRANPAVRMQVETGLSTLLFERLDRGEFDLVFAKRALRSARGEVLLKATLAWATAPGAANMAAQRPLPLALHPAPSVTRSLVLRALIRAGIKHAEVFNSPSIPGVRAGALASLGITAFGHHFIPAGLEILPAAAHGLPNLPELEFVLERRAGSLGQPKVKRQSALEEPSVGCDDQ